MLQDMENKPPNINLERNACLELALEGERLCKNGDFPGGVAFFEASLRVGTDDYKTLSAIYSQLGNAYFYVGNYVKAMEFHRCDLTVARAIGDELGEGKASGNLGSALKSMGKYEEAVTCCERHLFISKKLNDKVGEGRALYNLGNVYHAKGKRQASMLQKDPGEFSEEVKAPLRKAVENYERSLKIMTELGDRSAQGRACGNLGNTHYLLGNFEQAINYHLERLAIAKEHRDISAQRRAHNNLGNAHIFMGKFEAAAGHYKKTLQLAIELQDRAVEAQACYSLGNNYTLLHDYPTAIDYHLRHLRIAQELNDKIGEGQAYWSLGYAHSAIGNHEQALHYANRHLEISKECSSVHIGDQSGEFAAQNSISDIQKVLDNQDDLVSSMSNLSINSSGRMRRISMEQMDILKLTPDAKATKAVEGKEKKLTPVTEKSPPLTEEIEKLSQVMTSVSLKESKPAILKDSDDFESSIDEDTFFDLISRSQSKRMDDQRCPLILSENKENSQLLGNAQNIFPASTSQLAANNAASIIDRENNSVQRDDLFDMIAGMQSRRIDEQRASLPRLPGLMTTHYTARNNPILNSINNNNTIPASQGLHRPSFEAPGSPDDEFFEILMRCQANRIEDQRSTMPETANPNSIFAMAHCNGNSAHAAPTVPDEDFYSLIIRLQGGRIEDQRSELPVKPPNNKDKASTSGASTSGHSSKSSGSSSKTSSFRSSLKSVKGSLKR